jgi:hypothetical protein
MNSYDANPLQALTHALRIVTGMPNASWNSLIAQVSTDLKQRKLLYAFDQQCLDQLAQGLNESRTL